LTTHRARSRTSSARSHASRAERRRQRAFDGVPRGRRQLRAALPQERQHPLVLREHGTERVDDRDAARGFRGEDRREFLGERGVVGRRIGVGVGGLAFAPPIGLVVPEEDVDRFAEQPQPAVLREREIERGPEDDAQARRRERVAVEADHAEVLRHLRRIDDPDARVLAADRGARGADQVDETRDEPRVRIAEARSRRRATERDGFGLAARRVAVQLADPHAAALDEEDVRAGDAVPAAAGSEEHQLLDRRESEVRVEQRGLAEDDADGFVVRLGDPFRRGVERAGGGGGEDERLGHEARRAVEPRVGDDVRAAQLGGERAETA
jgi:hypothetical protein